MHVPSTIGLIMGLLVAAPARAGDVASYYGYESGSRTANGERFDPLGRTCAHRTHPFGTLLRVTYQGHSATCRVNDRGPFKPPRTLDVSLGVARSLGLVAAGVGPVTIEVLP
ncbi:septal ring lytic transglycosylase RlpA family protein [Rhodopseudomonas sp. P2A-2r]|uniref:septal ring lytic transglycosylase RlpA family protein n=1 Tax=Rhodopseudomonas sp. P2A-2r TaxID=2991972 RepID=UPI002234D569|nr:septal ring lytic transglycosylase RlpA family protein [Rhodopseudomonas sp. P2A-2r]UZE47903.1 septal ring lytic transglycosylase RlpA family protein [Rhodopseudomonas sp. P2A-2r]